MRYIVNDVEAAVSFYTQHLGFKVEMKPAPGFAMLSRGDLRLLLVAGRGGKQILLDDPSGNCIELFQEQAHG